MMKMMKPKLDMNTNKNIVLNLNSELNDKLINHSAKPIIYIQSSYEKGLLLGCERAECWNTTLQIGGFVIIGGLTDDSRKVP